MKNIIQIITAVVIISGMTGCATPYMTDRSRDAADIFTIRMGFGAGVKTHVGPVQVGLLFNLDCLGLRGGEMVWAEKVVNTGADFDYILGGVSEFDTRCLYPDSMAWKRDKCYRLSYVLLGIPVNTPVLCRLPNRYSPGYFTDIEVVGGLWTTLRFGFNPGELFDFILGWTTVDIYGDDIGIVQEDEKKESNKASAANPDKPGGRP